MMLLTALINAFSKKLISCRAKQNLMLKCFSAAEPDLSTVRKKLKEYAEPGLLRAEKQGNKLYYARQEDCIALEQ